jgi:FMN-dependent NADH-azoreductase
MKLLHIDSSALGPLSVTRELSNATVQAWRHAHPSMAVTYRDLIATPPPHLGDGVVQTLRFGKAPAATRQDDLALIETMQVEFLAADVVVIGAPMYNFGIPSQLKAWIDALAQPGRTFKYTPQGPRGLAGGKRVIVASSRGNVYSQPPMSALDFQEPYLVTVLQFMGVTEIDIVRAEGVNLGLEQRKAALEQAHGKIATLFAPADAVLAAA